MKLDHTKTPYLDALKQYVGEDVVCFDVPGHHMGTADNELKSYIGSSLFKNDINAPIGMDNLAHPSGPLLEAYKLMEDATGADHAFFLINGTTSGIIAMIMSVCKPNDKIILPRNVHKSIINALVISGAMPIYVMPELDTQLEIANQPSVEAYKRAILRYPSAKAIFVINPTYFGGTNDLVSLVEFAHSHGVAVLVDEAHGCHFYFNKNGPVSAMRAGADAASVSFHKTGGSLTQSSVLLLKDGIIDHSEIQKTLNMINTTSPNTILMASLDTARSHMALKGQEELDEVIALQKYAFAEVEKINGFIPCSKEHFTKHGCYNYDETKLVINIHNLDLDGFEVYRLLKKDYGIQIELAETYTLLCVFTIGTTKKHVDKLIRTLKCISKKHYNKKIVGKLHGFSLDFPFAIMRPRAAYFAPKKVVALEDAVYQISKEQTMIYPPGIPLVCPGEIITPEIVAKIKKYKEDGVTLLGDNRPGYVSIIDKDNWKHFQYYRKKYEDYLENKITNPINDGFYMPFEGDEHEGTLILLPFRKDTWRKDGVPARENYYEVIKSIAKYEKVYVGVHPRIYEKVIDEIPQGKNILPFKVRYNDAWARDNMPIFVRDNKGRTRCVDFRFNAWGGEVDGLYSNYKDDDKISSIIAKKFGLLSYKLNDFILEGGSIHVDGEGTCLVTSACLLSEGRNPSKEKYEIEETLKVYLNVEKVIWLPHGIYEDETNEHVDNICCFSKPGEVLLAWTNNKNDPQYEYCEECLKVLKKEVDAKGRKLVIHKISLPEPQYMDKNEAKSITAGKYNAKPRKAESRLAASYINFYLGKDFVILPAFGVKEDAIAKKEISKVFPEKEIIQLNSREILLGGGNIHCITMQIPKAKNEN